MKPNALSRLLKWTVELRQIEINFQPQTVIKGQVVADFIVEFTERSNHKNHLAPQLPEKENGNSM